MLNMFMIILFLFASLLPDTNTPHFLEERSGIHAQGVSELHTSDTDLESLFETLKIFYEATNGEDWSYELCPTNSEWDITKEPGSIFDLYSWCGLTFSNEVLTRIILPGNNLVGPFPPELGQLGDLVWLDLAGNQLTGRIPPEVGQLKKLTFLGLTNNQLSGPIPLELTTLDQLGALFLGQNELSGPIPPEIANLQQLRILALNHNQLTGTFPVELTTMEQLYRLSVWDNPLTGPIPPEIGNLSNLSDLAIGWTQITGSIPPELANLSQLKKLWVGRMPLTRADIILLGKIPLEELHFLGISFPEGIPPEIGELTSLTSIDVYYGLPIGTITGSIPPELGKLVNLEILDLIGEDLTGPIPPELGNLVNLESLRLSGSLTGPIPSELGNLVNLRERLILGGSLTGSIPPELGNLRNLQSLVLGGNNLTGTIPSELGNLVNLEVLNLTENDLTGPIPPELGNLRNLQSLVLGRNNLTGTIPSELGNLRNLERLFLAMNQLTGEIPSELGSLRNLEFLNIRWNQLTGALPKSFVQLKNLRILRFDENSGLCSPSDSEFQDWLGTIGTVDGDRCSVVSFSSEVSDQSYPVGLPISPLRLPEVAGGAPPIEYTLTLLDLPLGLRYDSSIRTISGTPTRVTPPVELTYKATDVNDTQDSLKFRMEVYSSVATQHQEALPEQFVLRTNYPNPFHHTTHLVMDLPQPAHIQVEVMDVMGRRVMRVPPVKRNAGWEQKIEIDGSYLSAGLYLYRVTVQPSEQPSMLHVGHFTRVR